MLDTLLATPVAYEQIINNEQPSNFVFPHDTIIIEEIVVPAEPNALQRKVKNKLSQKSKTGGFIQVLFFNKFKKFLVGEAHDIQTKKENNHLLEKITWQSPSYDFEYRSDMVTRSHNEKNTLALEEFRNHLDQNPEQIPGVVGLLNRYSQHRAYLAHHKDVLPQSDICYVGAKETFVLYNNSSQARPVAEMFVDLFGEPDNGELRLLRKWIAMDAVIPAYENYYYEDYSMECNLGSGGVNNKSWLSFFFDRKNSINPGSWNVTPVSYSPLSKELITQSKLSAHLYNSLEEFAYKQEIRFTNPQNENLNETVKEILAKRRNTPITNKEFSVNK